MAEALWSSGCHNRELRSHLGLARRCTSGTIRTLAGLQPSCPSGPVRSVPAEPALFYGASLSLEPDGDLAVDASLCVGNMQDEGFGPNLLLTSSGRFIRDASGPVPAVASVNSSRRSSIAPDVKTAFSSAPPGGRSARYGAPCHRGTTCASDRWKEPRRRVPLL